MALRIALLLVACAAVLGGPSAAGAVTWHNSGDTAFTGTATSISFGATGGTLTCPSASVTGTVPTSGFTGAVWPAMQMTVDYGAPCLLFLQPLALSCQHRFTAVSYAAGVTSGVLDATCDLFSGGVLTCHVKGALPATYVNPSGSATGRFTVSSSTVQFSDPTPPTVCFWSNDVGTFSETTVTITAASGGPVSPHGGPVLARTP